ncbi:hypothetical protein V6N11_008003 [Hibiscus sabdariffa]|uniref:Uncharacterized protein n=1 Tax=Hibiscus sabdariffa TaxID=183260 RepID=A0ABR2PZB4_9ROSI
MELPQDHFTADDIRLISSIPLSDVHQDDIMVWGGETKGEYSVRSGYRQLIRPMCHKPLLLVDLLSRRGVGMKSLIALPVLERIRLSKCSGLKKFLPKLLPWFKRIVDARNLRDFLAVSLLTVLLLRILLLPA